MMVRSRLISLGLCVIGAGSIWFSTSDELRSGTRAIALVALAGVGAILAGRGVFRRLMAVAVVLAGLGLVLGGTMMAIVGGIVVVIGGLMAMVYCPTWPVMGTRFTRAQKAEKTDLWTALDRGEDPTAR